MLVLYAPIRFLKRGRRVLAVVTIALGMSPGCTGIEPALVGAAVSGVGVGLGATRLGKLNVAFYARASDVADAAQRVGEELGLILVETRGDQRNRWVFHYIENRKNWVIITVQRRTSMITHTQVNVGWFGSGAVAQLVAKRIGAAMFGKDVDPGVLIVDD